MTIILAGLTATETFPLLSLMYDPDIMYDYVFTFCLDGLDVIFKV